MDLQGRRAFLRNQMQLDQFSSQNMSELTTKIQWQSRQTINIFTHDTVCLGLSSILKLALPFYYPRGYPLASVLVERSHTQYHGSMQTL